ncbi:DUF7342 family protein [Natronococcus roseus]|uniref:DUF7342 family protein n=1 Tax=Natronococcus roseus TaxID=1052014 RepID=UPI00374CCC5C
MMGHTGSGSSLIENPFVAGSTAERLYELLARTNGARTAAELAARADRDRGAVRETLESFVALGIVTKRRGSSPTYERNDRRFPRTEDGAAVLARERSLEELEARMDVLVDRVWRYQRRYDAETPLGVDGRTVDITPATLADWETARAELQRCERARRLRLREMVSGVEPEEQR